MGETSIEWTDATWNPVRGCKMVSPGCTHCYAMGQAHRFSGPGKPYEGLTKLRAKGKGAVWTGDFREVPEMLDVPLRTRKPTTWFVNSMSDLFGEGVSNEFIAAVFGVMAATPRHTYQVLTKRADRMGLWFEWFARWGRSHAGGGFPASRALLAAYALRGELFTPPNSDRMIRPGWPLPNVWLGVSVEDRRFGLPRIGELRETPAAVRFLSIEPLLEDLGELDLAGIHWVIVGGESGHGARPMHPDWARSIRDQCGDAKVPFFFKQWGEWAPGETIEKRMVRTEKAAEWFGDKWEIGSVTPRQSETMHHDDEPDLYRIGKKAAGRHLDGRTWDEMPARST